MQHYVSPARLAEELHVSVQTVRLHAAQGHFPSHRTPGGHRRFILDEVREALGGATNARGSSIKLGVPATARGSAINLGGDDRTLTLTMRQELETAAADDLRGECFGSTHQSPAEDFFDRGVIRLPELAGVG